MSNGGMRKRAQVGEEWDRGSTDHMGAEVQGSVDVLGIDGKPG